MLEKEGYVQQPAKDDIKIKLYNQFYAANQELFKQNISLYWIKAQKYIDENFRLALEGEQTPFPRKSSHLPQTPKSELTDILQANLTPQQLNAKALVMLANQLVLMKKAGSMDLYGNIGLIIDASMNLEPTEWDEKEFKGTQVADALRIYGLNAAETLLSISPDLKKVLVQIAEPDKLPKNTEALLTKLAHLNYAMQAIPKIVAYQLRPNGLYSYHSAALLASRAAIPMESFTEAMIIATQREIALPHFIMGRQGTVDSIVVNIEKTWYGAVRVVKKAVKNIGRLAKPLPDANVSNVDDNQVESTASWMGLIIDKAKKLPENVKELEAEVEEMLKEKQLAAHKA